VPKDEQLRAGLDAIQGDMAKHQQMFRGEVTGEANRVLAVAEFERLEQHLADQESAAESSVPPAQPQSAVRTAEVDGRRYVIDQSAVDDIAFRKATTDEDRFMRLAGARIDILLEKREPGSGGDGFLPEFVRGEVRSSATPRSAPSWHERVLSVLAWKAGAQEPRNLLHRELLNAIYQVELVRLLDDSNRHFGDWMREPEPKVMVG
jgi:hypothetical protein